MNKTRISEVGIKALIFFKSSLDDFNMQSRSQTIKQIQEVLVFIKCAWGWEKTHHHHHHIHTHTHTHKYKYQKNLKKQQRCQHLYIRGTSMLPVRSSRLRSPHCCHPRIRTPQIRRHALRLSFLPLNTVVGPPYPQYIHCKTPTGSWKLWTAPNPIYTGFSYTYTPKIK